MGSPLRGLVPTGSLRAHQTDCIAGIRAGFVYLYGLDGSLITSVSGYAFSGGSIASDSFGYSVAPSGTNHFIVGSPLYDDGFFVSGGMVFLYDLNGSVISYIRNPEGTVEGYGNSVAGVSSDRIIVGIPDPDGSAHGGAGQARIFATNDFGAQGIKIPESVIAGEHFGASLAAFGSDAFLVGAPFNKVNGFVNAGTIYVYSTNSTLVSPLDNPSPKINDYFGSSVAVNDNTDFVVGAPQYSAGTGASGNGEVFLYRIPEYTLCDTFSLPASPKAGYVPTLSQTFQCGVWELGTVDDPAAGLGYPTNAGIFDIVWRYTDQAIPPKYEYLTNKVFIKPYPVVNCFLGQWIPPPPCADLTMDLNAPPGLPTSLFWHQYTQKLYATGPGSYTNYWKRSNNSTVPQQINIQWPTNASVYQIHVANTPPVDLTNGVSNAFSSLLVQEPGTAATVIANQFQSGNGGRSMILLSPGPNPQLTNIFFQFVQTILWSNTNYFSDTNTAVIGQEIVDPAHNPGCGSPYVFDYLEANHPWRVCVDNYFYNRTNRTGPVIPVNRSAGGTRSDDLLLILYQFGTNLYEPVTGTLLTNTIAWPYKPSRYLSVWPADDPKTTIFIAGGQGSGPISLPDPYWSVYRQTTNTLDGYNPNEEHALRLGAPPPLLHLKISTSAMMMAEGGSNQFTVSLTGDAGFAPTADVNVTVTTAAGGDTNLFVVFPTNASNQQLVFTPDDWQTNTQTLTIVANTNIATGSNTFFLSASGGLIDQATVQAYEQDTNRLGLVVEALAFNITEGGQKAFKVQLSKNPINPVTVTTTNRGIPNVDSPVLHVLSGGTMMFNSANWNVPQFVAIQADADADFNDDTAIFNVTASGALNTNVSISITQSDTTPIPDAVYALRNDLGDAFGTTSPKSSEPYVLLKYTNLVGRGAMSVYKVRAEDTNHQFVSHFTAGQKLQPPNPLNILPKCDSTQPVSGPYYPDHNKEYWAKAAAISSGGLDAPTNIVMHYFYHPEPTFDPPAGSPPYSASDCLPWLDQYARTPGTPTNYTFVITWPSNVPQLRVGESLIKPKSGLPDIANQCSVDVIYEQTGPGTLVQLYDPLSLRSLPVSNLTGNKLPTEIVTQVDPADQKLVFMSVPLTIRNRLKFNPNVIPPTFEFIGSYDDTTYVGEPLLLPNVMTLAEANILKSLSSDSNYRSDIDALRSLTINSAAGVSHVESQFKALSAAYASGQGYVSLALQDSTNCGTLPVSVAIIKVTCPLYQGDIKPIYPDCAFDESLTMHHSADFAGNGDNYQYEWFYRQIGTTTWILDPRFTNGDYTINAANSQPLQVLEDFEYYCHYRPISGSLLCGPSWSPDTKPAEADGWLKRVLTGISPFNQTSSDFRNGVNTVADMIQQAGQRWQGDIALNCLPGNNFGLIEAYETVFRRGIDLTIGSGFKLTDDTALRDAAGNLCDLYMLLGNEAYADAEDPTIAFGTDSGQYTATSVHCFQGQTTSLLEEELALLRGRDGPYGTSQAVGTRVDIPPVYNRLYPNFGPDQDGQDAYVLNYNINPATLPQALAQFPQGHGDAWGHYLSAITPYYRLLSNSNYVWTPVMEAVDIGGAEVQVNYEHERKFAKAAAARAQSGAEIVGLTYRQYYTEDPASQWQGYRDSDTNRAWGVSEWASRSGQAALFDWMAGNAILPANDTFDPPQQKVDRTTVPELRQIAASFLDIQQAMDNADQGLNPLGLDKNVVPFGIDPSQLTSGQTHFDQIYARAITAMNNAVAVWNYANQPSQLLRKQQDDETKFQQNVDEQLNDFTNQLIEIYGYPYNEDIGGSGAFPVGYVGPDLYHFNYVDVTQLAGVVPPTTQTLSVNLQDLNVAPDGTLYTNTHPVMFNLSSDNLELVKPANFTSRRSPGDLQRNLSDLTQARVRFEQALTTYDNLISQIEDQAALIQSQYNLNADEIQVVNANAQTQLSLNDSIASARSSELGDRSSATLVNQIAEAVSEFLPAVNGIDNDFTSVARGAIKLAATATTTVLSSEADEESLAQLDAQQAKEDAQNTSNIKLTTIHQNQALLPQLEQLEQMVRQEAVQRYDIYNLREAVAEAAGNYQATLSKGNRVYEDRLRFLQQTAQQVQQYRYTDMAFRIFRNDALQKYRSQFDLAARYVYLAAKAYDYETGLLQTDTKAGAAFLEDIVKKRAIGTIQNGIPISGPTGDSGLAASMAAMGNDYAAIKANLGLNNQVTRQRLFSLKNGWFRIGNASTNNLLWQNTLRMKVVDNIWDIPEFERYCRPLRPQPANGHEPGIVISFPSMIVAENNFFGLPAGGGDSGYNASLYSTKILSAGIWFSSYDSTANGLVQFPSAWLIPVGDDVVRASGAQDFSTRHWKVYDEKIPVPNNFLTTPPNYALNWIPINFSLNGEFGAVGGSRLYNAIDATTDSQSLPFDTTHMQTDSGLVGRSVWNTQWMLIIPGVGLLGSDPDTGLDKFINTVTDIKIYFQTYSYSGF